MSVNTARIQRETDRILEKISEKVEVVVDHTSSQIDRAWEYITRPAARDLIGVDEDRNQREDEIREKVRQEARREATKVLREAGLDSEKLEAVLPTLESVAERSVDITKAMTEEREFLEWFASLDKYLRRIAGELTDIGISDAPFSAVMDIVSSKLEAEILSLIWDIKAIRDGVMHGKVNAQQLRLGLLLAPRIASYLRGFQDSMG